MNHCILSKWLLFVKKFQYRIGLIAQHKLNIIFIKMKQFPLYQSAWYKNPIYSILGDITTEEHVIEDFWQQRQIYCNWLDQVLEETGREFWINNNINWQST